MILFVLKRSNKQFQESIHTSHVHMHYVTDMTLCRQRAKQVKCEENQPIIIHDLVHAPSRTSDTPP